MTNFVVQNTIFQGPIALLHEMIEKRNLSISEFSLMQITEEFINFVSKIKKETENSEIYKYEVSQFIQTAAILILLKSKSLIPELIFSDEETREVEILENQLQCFAILKEKKNIIKNLWNKNKLHTSKIKHKNDEKIFIPSVKMDKVFFYKYLQNKLSELIPNDNKKEVRVVNKIKIEDALNHVRNIIKKIKKINLHSLQTQGNGGDERLFEKNKKNVVILFLAILELTKIGEINVAQNEMFSDIMIEESMI